jgi:ligand-binding sensor domain-containing protein
MDGRVAVPDSGELRRPSSAVFARAGAVYVAQPNRLLILTPEKSRAVELPEAHPRRVWADGGEVWVAGMDGLYRVRGKTVTRMGAINGKLAAQRVAALAPWEGGLLVGTHDGGLLHVGADGAARPVFDRAWANLGTLAALGERIAVGETGGGLWLHDGGTWRRLKREDGLASNDVTAVLFENDFLWVGTKEGLARLRLPPPPLAMRF